MTKLRILLITLLYGISLTAIGGDNSIYPPLLNVVIPESEKSDNSKLKNIVLKLADQDDLKKYQVNIIGAKEAELLPDTEILIAASEKAIQELNDSNSKNKVIAIFVKNTEGNKYDNNSNISLIYGEPSPLRQLALAKVIYGANAHCYLFTSEDNSETEEYFSLADKVGVNLEKIDTSVFTTASQILTAAKEWQCGIPQRNPNPFPGINLNKLSEKLYEYNNFGLLFYSPGLIKNIAGVGLTYSSLGDIANEIDTRLNQHSQDGTFRKSGYTSNYSLSTNWYILRSLNLASLKEEQAREKIDLLLRKSRL